MTQKSNDPRRYNRSTFLCPNLILVEGPDDFQFLRFLRPREDLQIHVYEGKNNLQKELTVLKAIEGFRNLIRIVLMRDADDDPYAALRSVLNQWSGATGEPLPVVDAEQWFSDSAGREWLVWIIPDANSPGDIEELLWRTVEVSPHKACVEDMIQCLERLVPVPFGAKTKALIYSWLATQSEPIKQLYVALDPNVGLFNPAHLGLQAAAELIDSI